MYRISFRWIFVIVTISLPILVFAVVKWYENNFERLPVLGGENHRIENFAMTNAFGKPVTLEDWNNNIVVADFFFTHCPVICPKMTNSLKRVQDAFSNDDDILINSFSIDPERDDPERLRIYAQKFSIDTDNWHLLTGDKKEIYKLARNGFMIVATDGDGGPDDFIHSEKLVLIDKHRRIRGYYDGTNQQEVSNLISDIQKLQYEK